jgi:hypothetical protein
MLRLAAGAYGWSGPGLVDAMLATVRHVQAAVAPGLWGRGGAGVPGTQQRPVPHPAARLGATGTVTEHPGAGRTR